VIVSSGAKIQQETDFQGHGSWVLRVKRTYRTLTDGFGEGNSAGNAWWFSFDRLFLMGALNDQNRPDKVDVTAGDGSYFHFDWDPILGKYVPKFEKTARLEALNASNDDWMFTQPDGRIDRFKKLPCPECLWNSVRLVSSQTPDGQAEYYDYGAPDNLYQLKSISDQSGRKLEVNWAANAISSISGPEGVVQYNYDWLSLPDGTQEAPYSKRLIGVEYFGSTGNSVGKKQYHYEVENRRYFLTGITDENGTRYATYGYDGFGQVVLSEHAEGADRHTFTYPDENTRVVTDPLGAERRFQVHDFGNGGVVTNENQPAGAGATAAARSIDYGSQGSMSGQTDFNGNKTCYLNDAQRNLETSRVSGLVSSDSCPTTATAALPSTNARRISAQWHPDFSLRTGVAEPNRITNYFYNGQPDSSGKVASCAPDAVLPNGKPIPLLCSMTVQATEDSNGASGFSAKRTGNARTWTYNYDANGHLLTSTAPTDANGRSATESRTYYQDATATHRPGDLTSVTNAAGEVTQYLEYSPDGLATVMRQANGQTITLSYGPRQRLMNLAIAAGDGNIERSEFEYDNAGNLTRATKPDGSSVTYTYDRAHRLTDITDSVGNRKHFDLDGMGNVVQEQVFGASGELTWKLTHSFDVLDRLQVEQRALQQVGAAFQYDRNGNLTALIDELGRTTTRQYDRFDRVVREQLPIPSWNSSRHLIYYTYDQQDQLLTVRDPKGLTTRYTVDGFGQRTALSSPDTGASSATFDGAGNLLSSVDARAVATNYVYDATGRVTRAGNSSFQYGAPGSAAAGQLTIRYEDSGRTWFSYDGFGRVLTKTQTVTGTVNRSFGVRYAYGTGAATGHVASLTYPSGNRIDIAYDGVGRPSSLTLLTADGTTSAPLLTQISYRPFGAVSGWTWGNSSAASPNKYVREFDLEGKLISYPLGHPSNNGAIRTLHYDAVGRITSITHTGSAQASALDQTYYYDDLDRLTGFDAAAASQRYQYDMNGNRIQATFGSSTYTNSVSATSNRLDSTTGPAPAKTNTYDAAGNLLSDGTVLYTYNANGRMDSASTDGITTRYRYNGRGERLIKTSSVNTSYYVYDEQGHLLGEYDGSGKPIQETVYLGDLPVAVVSPGASGPAITYIYADHLQAPRVLTQASDNRMVWRWDQADPFDLTQPDENPSGLGKFTYNLRFPGQVFDRETNNHYNYHRDYDPQLGRYIESDPIGLNGGINTYAYGLGNPVSNVDPEGLFVPLLIPGLCAAGGCEALLAGAAILMSPPGQKAIKSGADAIAKSCTPDDLDRCEKAKQDARFRYRTLVNKRIPQYLGGGTRGSDANHYA
jgi:RHS repeat-associated protein